MNVERIAKDKCKDKCKDECGAGDDCECKDKCKGERGDICKGKWKSMYY